VIGRIIYVALILCIVSFNYAFGQLSLNQLEYNYGIAAGVFNFTSGYFEDSYTDGYVVGGQVTVWPLPRWGLQLEGQYYSAQAGRDRMSMIPFTLSVLMHLYNPRLTRIIKPYFGAGVGRYNIREKIKLSDEKINYTVNSAHAILGIFIGRSANRGFVFQAKYSSVPFDHPLDISFRNSDLNNMTFTGGYRF